MFLPLDVAAEALAPLSLILLAADVGVGVISIGTAVFNVVFTIPSQK